MKIKLSQKQRLLLSWWRSDETKDMYGIICDGAVRSGKTFAMSLSFTLWAMTVFNGKYFAFCGKTQKSLKRNVTDSLRERLSRYGFCVTQRVSESYFTVSLGSVSNRFYLFGGRDESSAALIQGVTLAGVMFDEAALMPQSFIEQAAARCSVEGAKLWFNCNPENARHPFKLEWIDRAEEKRLLYVTFIMRDNPSLSRETVERYETMYTGAFYERFILGRWVSTQGLVYPFFGPDCVGRPPGDCELYRVSIDYGTRNPTSMGLWGLCRGVWYRVDEYYFSSVDAGFQRTDEEYYAELEKLAGDRRIQYVIVDPSAASFIECVRRHGRFRVVKARNDVIDGIRVVSDALKSGKMKISPVCRDAVREFETYRWDDKKSDAPLKKDDHAMDDVRYFAQAAFGAKQNGGFFAAARRN